MYFNNSFALLIRLYILHLIITPLSTSGFDSFIFDIEKHKQCADQ